MTKSTHLQHTLLTYDKAAPYDDATAADDMFLTYGNIQADDYDGDEITVNVQKLLQT